MQKHDKNKSTILLKLLSSLMYQPKGRRRLRTALCSTTHTETTRSIASALCASDFTPEGTSPAMYEHTTQSGSAQIARVPTAGKTSSQDIIRGTMVAMTTTAIRSLARGSLMTGGRT